MAALDLPCRDRYRVLRVLGEGGSAVVYEAQAEDGRKVALKVIDLGLSGGDPRRAQREIEGMRRFDHPALLRCLEAGVDGAKAWLVLELAEGALDHEIRKGDLGPGELFEHIRHAASGIAELHRLGYVHRDVKPANILLVGGKAKVADLGMLGGFDLETLTRTGTVLGTPAFMAPELLSGGQGTPASDVYALGVTFYAGLERRLPHPPGLTLDKLMARILAGQLLPMEKIPELCSEAARAVLAACLARDAGRRPKDAGELVARLGSWEEARRGGSGLRGREAGGSSGALGVHRSDGFSRRLPGGSTARAALLGLGVVLVVLAGLSRWAPGPGPGQRGGAAGGSGSGDPARPVGPRDRGAGPGPEGAGREASLLPRSLRGEAPLREALETAGSLYVTARGQLIQDETGSRPPGSDPLLEPDPLRWPLVVRALEPLAAFHSWLADGGRVERLTEEDAARLRAEDDRLEVLGFPPVFGPFLGLAPATAPVAASPEVGEWLGRSPELGGLPTREDGWWGTVLRELGPLVRELTARSAELRRVAEGAPAEGALGDALATGRLDPEALLSAPGVAGLESRLRYIHRDPRRRPALDRWTRPLQTCLQRVLHALVRYLEESPERDLRVGLAHRLGADLGVLWCGSLAYLPVEAMLGRRPTRPAGWYLAALALEGAEVARRSTGLQDDARLEAVLEGALGDPGSPAAPSPRLKAAYLKLHLRLLMGKRQQELVDLWRRHGAMLPAMDDPHRKAMFGHLATAALLPEDPVRLRPEELRAVIHGIGLSHDPAFGVAVAQLEALAAGAGRAAGVVTGDGAGP